jgi:hypothetical protein
MSVENKMSDTQAISKIRLLVTKFPRNWWPTKLKQRTELGLNDSADV